MSDLQCPATFLIARPGEARSAMDCLTCDDSGGLTDKGRQQVRQLVEHLVGRRLAAVYAGPMEPAIESAELAASRLGLRPVVVAGLQGLTAADFTVAVSQDDPAREVDGGLPGGVGYPRAEGGHRVVRRFAEAIGGIADIHRGESVLVFTSGGLMSLAIPRISANVGGGSAGRRFVPNCAVAEVEVDADGWRLLSWPSSADLHISATSSSAIEKCVEIPDQFNVPE
jgi:probable phosphoglycerate mutase